MVSRVKMKCNSFPRFISLSNDPKRGVFNFVKTQAARTKLCDTPDDNERTSEEKKKQKCC